MNKLAKKLKNLVKGECSKPNYGTDPNDPWSAKAGITEDLNAYLKSKGIDPRSVSTNTKISHAKSSAYLKWKRDHQFEEVQYVTEDKWLDLYLVQHGINPKTLPKEKKIAYSKTTTFIKWKENHMHEEISAETPTHMKQKTLDKKEKAGKIIHTEEITDPHHAPATHTAVIRDSKGLTTTVVNIHAKSESEAKKKGRDKAVGDGAVSKVEKLRREDVFADSQAATQSNFDGANAPDNTEPENPGSKRKQELMKSARIIKSIYKKKRMTEAKHRFGAFGGGGAPNNPGPGSGTWDHMEHETDPYARGLYNLNPKNPHPKDSKEHHEYNREWQNGFNDRRTHYEEYVREDMFDHEKEDKSVTSYGKKPKMLKVSDDKLKGDNAPKAAAVLSGGKTLTGQSRDTLEIDPEMQRPLRFDNKMTDSNKR